MAYALLGFAIVAEILATSLMKETDGFTRPLPTLACLAGYAIAFALLAQAVKSIQVGVAYAMWAGIGTVAIAVIGALFLSEPLTAAKAAGIALVVAGVTVLNLGGAH
jgi:small multidrug resistance pump